MSMLKFVFENKNTAVKPVGTKIKHSGKTYVKESTGWYNVETGNKLNYKSTLILEANENRHKIDFVEKPDGYYLNGMKMTPEQAAPFVNYEHMSDSWYNKKSGSAINREDERVLDQKALAVMKQLYKEHDEANPPKDTEEKEEESNETSAEPQDEVSNDEKAESEQSTDSENQEEPEQQTQDAPKEEPKAQSEPESTPDTSSEDNTSADSSIPNGFVYTSGKGNKFILKNGTWYNASTKKPVNQSNVNMLNRSAAKAVEDYNSKNEIKIGSKVKSNKGVEYTFNGTGFVGSDGRMLTGGAAQSALNKLKAQNAPSTQSTDAAPADNSTQGTPSTASAQDTTIVPGQSALDTQPNPAPTSTPADSASTDSTDSNSGQDYTAQSIINGLDGQNSSETGSTAPDTQSNPAPSATPPASTQPKDPMTELAQKIKGSKYNKQIITLLSRGGDMDLIAADILLNGNVQEVINQLKSLNNSNTQ